MQNGLALIDDEKSLYDQVLLSKDFSKVCHYVINIAQCPELMCSFSKFVGFDFQGRLLQDNSDLEIKLDSITCSIIATKHGGAIVFSWMNIQGESCNSFIESLDTLSDFNLPHAIVRYVFSFCENVFFNPDWWDNLGPQKQDALKRRLWIGVNPYIRVPSTSLCDDGVRAVSWRILSRYRVNWSEARVLE